MVRDRLQALGLDSRPMVTGGKGVHVVVALEPRAEWPEIKAWARAFAESIAAADPANFVATMSKAKRTGRIFIDWLRNQRGATAVLPYSARSRDNAPVAVPIAWGELAGMKDAHPFTIRDAGRLLTSARGKGLSGWGFADQVLTDL